MIANEVKELINTGVVEIKDHPLQNDGKVIRINKPTIIFPLPSVGSKIILLEHLFDARKQRQCSTYGAIKIRGKYTLYTVEEYTVGIDYPFQSNNFLVVTYQREKGPVVRQLIPAREISCGFYEAMVLSEEDIDGLREKELI